MVDFRSEDLSGSTFDDVDLTGARFKNALIEGVSFRGVWAKDVELEGDIKALRVNGIDVMPLWRAEMVRQCPEYALLQPTDAEGYRQVWPLLEQQWQETVTRARRLPEELLHESVDGEYSFIQTLRHLVFATDAWVLRALLGEPYPYAALGLPYDEMEPIAGVPAADRDVRPSLDEVLALRAERQATVREVLADLTDERLTEHTTPVLEPGYPESESYTVPRCLLCILDEEWWHHRFAVRDLTVLELGVAGR